MNVVSSPVWIFGRGIVRPVKVEVTGVRGGFVASNPDTFIHGAGATFADAIEDLRAALTEHHAVLQFDSDRLAPHLTEQLGYLNRHLASCPGPVPAAPEEGK